MMNCCPLFELRSLVRGACDRYTLGIAVTQPAACAKPRHNGYKISSALFCGKCEEDGCTRGRGNITYFTVGSVLGKMRIIKQNEGSLPAVRALDFAMGWDGME
jgi:hypothetical protein